MTIKNPFSFAKVQNYWRRQGVVKYVFILICSLFSYQVVSISNAETQGLSVAKRAESKSLKQQTTYAKRGDIVDRNGEILASSRLLKKVNLDPMLVEPEFIPELAKALEINEDQLKKTLAKKRKIGSKYLIIKKNITLTSPIIQKLSALKRMKLPICRDKKIADKLSLTDQVLTTLKLKSIPTTYTVINKCKRKKIAGVAIQQDTQRYYPKSASLAPLLGRLNRDKKGTSGIEGEFDNILAGTNGKIKFNYQENSKSYFDPQVLSILENGSNIELTIDTNIQYHAYEAIKKSVLKHEADSGSAIILSPDGEVLAMVNYPADDPNDKQVYNAEHYRNRVLSDKVEPGSTMKPFTMLLALDRGKITATEDELIDVSKRIGHIRSDHKARKYGDAITVKKILQKSHNLGTVNVSERLDKEDMYNTWNKLGFGHQLGLIPSIENSGSLRHFDSWALSDKRSLSFGHGPMETNLAQLARAYLVFANEGAIPSLKLIKNASNYENTVQVFNKESTDKIAELLDSVASWKGSGYRARIKGYDVAGKTGTAEMVVNGRYNKDGAKRTFFTGFVPVKQPKYIMAVRLDYPKKCYVYKRPDLKNKCEGSNSASMVFHDAMKNILSNDKSIQLSSNH